MSNDGKIFITITDSPVGSDGNGGNGTREQRLVKKPKEQELMQHQVFNFVLNEAKQVANYAINNIGNFTGDYNAQRSIQHTVQIGSKLANIGMAFAVNPVIGAMAVIGAGISFAEQEYANQFAIRKQNYTINRLRDISGLDNLTNGSR